MEDWCALLAFGSLLFLTTFATGFRTLFSFFGLGCAFLVADFDGLETFLVFFGIPALCVETVVPAA